MDRLHIFDYAGGHEVIHFDSGDSSTRFVVDELLSLLKAQFFFPRRLPEDPSIEVARWPLVHGNELDSYEDIYCAPASFITQDIMEARTRVLRRLRFSISTEQAATLWGSGAFVESTKAGCLVFVVARGRLFVQRGTELMEPRLHRSVPLLTPIDQPLTSRYSPFESLAAITCMLLHARIAPARLLGTEPPLHRFSTEAQIVDVIPLPRVWRVLRRIMLGDRFATGPFADTWSD